ncbi:MAG: PD-(D/E)XK nuclease family protein [Chloroflexia bacterium]|nr:PD-(D/E)XK nuclease family protein [Chloroflexia bacterium]
MSPTFDESKARTPLIAGMPGPRWNRNKGIYPTSLRRYLECPHRCRLEYVDKVPYDLPWSRAMEVGNALHKVMEQIAIALHNRQEPPPISAFRSWVGEMLPADRYDDQDQRARDIENVLEWTARGTAYITRGDSEVLIVEHYSPRRWDDLGDLGSVLLGAKADVVVRRHDEAGAYIEIIDYKTGHNREYTQFTPILSAIALKRRIRFALRQPREPRIVFTYIWFEKDEFDERWLTAEAKRHQWEELRPILVRMVHEEDWPKQPGYRICKFCPYYNTECFPFPETASDPDVPTM